MLQNLTGWHALIIIAVVVLLFGATKLPALARSVGQSMRILKTETAGHGDGAEAETADRGGERHVAGDRAEASTGPATASGVAADPVPPTVAVRMVTATAAERSGSPTAP
ncbi:twin-arginine translocase TatA/TatE family subunit [Mycetocola reblochoni]|uniref:Sec-independent protein translocase protein TatA n=2 Tax=Mycetocola reblochoni TaxID=331618 RepID=A0A1R4I8D0_9MICO|nr:twin-arginine translocase TatA/TatE family subunit [Mycetocola reblochoni]RLP68946.1 Sec-independent protein translocase TatA [Mycetocola reblochoni]SJN16092.1 Twin-arginine translocation protein TatA [Mycetocola reblochoni REB411]